MNPFELSFLPISPAGGAEIIGLDLHNEQVDDVKNQLKKASFEHSFLLLRDQDISSVEQCRYGRIFGKLLEVESIKRETNIVATTGELSLHFDHWLIDNYPQPTRYTMLYGMEVPPVRGETLLVNVQRAYQCLPDSLKNQIACLQAVHCYDYTYERTPSRVREAEIPPGQPKAIHPLVLDHPDSGEKILYLSPTNTDRILDMSPEKSEALLQELFTYIKHPDNVYAHKWKKGDLLIFDNYAMMHGRKNYDPQYKRQLRRLSMI
jgi:taurine dioxygenase